MRVLTEISTCTYQSIYVYLRKCLPRTYFGEYVVLISGCYYRRAPRGRYSCIAQGASPGLIIGTHLLSPKGAALSRRKANVRVVVPLLRSSYFLSVCIPRVSYRALPSFHPGLCRSVALSGLMYVFTTNQLLCCFDVFALEGFSDR